MSSHPTAHKRQKGKNVIHAVVNSPRQITLLIHKIG